MGFVSISDRNIKRVLSDPPLLWKFIAPDDEEAYEEARAQPTKQTFFSKLLGKGPTSDELTLQEGELADTSVDKAWAGLNYLFCGKSKLPPFPSCFLFAGREVPNSDNGYGAARVLSSSEVRQVNSFLASFSEEQIQKRYDAEEMMRLEVYPTIWDRKEEGFEYLSETLAQLRDFVKKAKEHGLGMIIHVD